MMKKIVFVFSFLFLFMVQTSAYAFTVYESSGSAILVAPYYDASTDKYWVEFDPSIVHHVYYGSYTDSSFTTVVTWKEVTEGSGGFVGTHRFNCNRFYKATYYDEADNIVGRVEFQGTEIINESCASGAESNDGFSDPDPTPSPGGDTGGSSGDCSTAVCECIQTLQGVNEQILSSTTANGVKLDSIVTNTASIPHMSETLDGVLAQMTTDQNAELPPEGLPDYSTPQTDTMLEDNKPSEPSTPYQDTNTYFSDSGDAPQPEGLPEAPDVAECWDKVGMICKETDMSPETELSKDADMIKDVMTQDVPMSKDTEMTKDVMTQDVPMSKDAEMTKDVMTQDAENSKTHSFTQDAEQGQTNFYQKQQPMTQTELNQPLPDWQQ